MYTKDDLLESLRDEVRIINHLYEKIPEGALDYRPTEKQRSLQELLQYLAIMGEGGLKSIQDGTFDSFEKHREDTGAVDITNFQHVMNDQFARMEESINEMGDELFEEIALMGPGSNKKRALHMIDLLLKMFAAYRMQLFLYIKAAGRHDIDTYNVWGGMDNPNTQAQ